jgi:hypothetical protein
MIEQFRRFLSSTAGKVAAAFVSFALLGVAYCSVRSFLKGDTPDTAFYTTYVCTETGKSFRHLNQIGETLPILSPYSGKNTGMPAEPCYWTKEGKAKADPTWVLLNSEKPVPEPEPTFCPDCGRLVVPRNPPPKDGRPPPPTREEWFAQHAPPK